MNRDNCFDTDMEFVTTGTSVKCVKHFWVLVKCLRFFSSKIDIFLECYSCKRFDEFQVCSDVSSCQGNGVSNREKLNFEKVFLSLFLPGAEGGRRWAISAIPMKNPNNKKTEKYSKYQKQAAGQDPYNFHRKIPEIQKQVAGQGPLQMRAHGEPHPSK